MANPADYILSVPLLLVYLPGTYGEWMVDGGEWIFWWMVDSG
jgi:hypothetical protein